MTVLRTRPQRFRRSTLGPLILGPACTRRSLPMADTSAIEIPADLAAVAEEKGIPMDIVRRALALGFPADAIKGQMSMPGVTAEAAEALISEQERIRAGGEITIPPELLPISREHNWPEDLIKRAIKL